MKCVLKLSWRFALAVSVFFSVLAVTQAAAQSAAGSLAETKARLRDTRPAGFTNKLIELMVAYPAGGGMDSTARVLAKYLEKYIDQPVVVMNRAGAAGLIGEQWFVTQAKAEGYNLALMASNFWSDSMLHAEGKWSFKDTDAIAFVNFDPPTWVISEEGRWKGKTLKDLVAAAKEKPGTISVAASSTTSTAFIVDQIEAATGAKFLRVLYQGDRQAITDLLGGHLDISYGYIATYRGLLDGGRVKTIGVASRERISAIPGAPTFNEVVGTDDIVWDAFRFVVVPKGVADDRRAWLESALNAAIGDPGIVAEFTQLGAMLDRRLNSAKLVAQEVERRSTAERAYHVRMGRLK